MDTFEDTRSSAIHIDPGINSTYNVLERDAEIKFQRELRKKWQLYFSLVYFPVYDFVKL